MVRHWLQYGHRVVVFCMLSCLLPVANARAHPTDKSTSGVSGDAKAGAAPSSVASEKTSVRVLVLDPTPSNVEKVTVEIVSALIAVEISRVDGIDVITASDVQKMFDLEASKMDLGCDAVSCLTEMGNALGSELVVFGNVGRLGELYVVTLNLFDTRVADSKGRISIQTTKIEDLPALMSKQLPALFSKVRLDLAPVSLAPPVVERKFEFNKPAGSSPQERARAAVPPAGSDRSITLAPEVLDRVQVFVDGAGNYLVRDLQKESFAPFYAGSLERLYAQRIIGGGASGNTQWNEVFWDPRHGSNWLSSAEFRNEKLTLRCGEKVIDYQLLSLQKSRDAMAKARFFDVRWQRSLHAVLRNDNAEWWVIDRARTERVGITMRAKDFRVYHGRRGHFRMLALQDVVSDSGGELFFTEEGKLVLPKDNQARWETGDATAPIKWLDLYETAAHAYGDLGVYTEPLGTPCDAYWE